MVKTEFYPRSQVIPIWLSSILIVLLIVGDLKAQYPPNNPSTYLACNDQVHVSLDEDCIAYITPDILLEGEENYPAPYNNLNHYSISIETTSGSGISGYALTVPGSYNVSVIETYSGLFNSCWGTVIIEDKLPPKLVDDPYTSIDESCPCPVGNTNPDCVISATCDELDNMLNGDVGVLIPEYEDCTTVNVNYIDVVVEYGPCSPIRIQRQYILEDANGNKTTTCVNEYTVDPLDIYTDILNPIAHIELPCNSDYGTDDIYDYYYELKLDQLIHYAYTDDEIAAAELAAHQFAIAHAYPTIYGQPVWNSLCNVVIAKSDLIIPACESCNDLKKILRTWSYFDWCTGKSNDFTQVIVNGDLSGPTIYHPDFSMTVDPWECEGNFYMPYPEHLHDPCSNEVSYSVTGPYGVDISYHEGQGYYVSGAPKGVHTFYYHGHDCCDNISTHPVTVHIVDGTPPIAVASQELVISLTPGSNGDGIAKLFASNVDKGSHDGCGPVHLEVRREEDYCNFEGNTTYNNDGHPFDDEYDLDNGEFVKFCCTDIADHGVDEDGDGAPDYATFKVWLRVWDDGDMDGHFGSQGDNYNETWAIVRVEDKVQPQVICPPDITIDCDVDVHDLYKVGEAQGINSCGTAEVEFEDTNHGCGSGLIERKWSIVGYPNSFCIQRIYREESYYNQVNIVFPEDTIIDCTINLEDQVPYWTAPTCNLLAYSVERDTFFFEEGACFKILNHWSVIDWCIYDPLNPYSAGRWEDVQVVKIYDDEAPFFPVCDEFVMVEADDYGDEDGNGIICESHNVMLTNMAVDNGDCASDWLKWTVQVDLYNDWNFEYIFSSSAPYNSPLYVEPTSSNEEVKITLPDGIPGGQTSHRVVWKVTDGCGNIRSCTQYFMVADKKAPTPYCVNVSSALMEDGEIELWACDFDLGSFDNCSENEDLRFTFSETHPDLDPNYNPDSKCASMLFTCDDIISNVQPNPVELDVYVWDENDNVDFCTVFLTLIDDDEICPPITGNNATRIGGQLTTVSGEELAQFSVELTSPMSDNPLESMTDAQGHYIFDNNPMGLNYSITTGERDDWLNGVTTLDLVLIQKHILGLQQLDNPYKIIAADVSNDENVSAIDLVQLRKAILGIYDEFPSNESWRFPISGQTMSDDYPWPFTEVHDIPVLGNTMMDNDFIGVKIGDINGSAVLSLNGDDIQNRSASKWIIYAEQPVLNSDGNFEVAIKTLAPQQIAGMQMTIQHAGMELLEVVTGGIEISGQNFARRTDEATTFSWNNAHLVNIEKDQTLMRLIFNGKGQIGIDSELVNAEAYFGKNLSEVGIVLQSATGAFENALFQNEPNPFEDQTSIGFSLAQSGIAKLSIYDINGKLVKVVSNFFTEGVNEIILSTKDIQTTGLLYYQLESGDFTATKKMIVVE